MLLKRWPGCIITKLRLTVGSISTAPSVFAANCSAWSMPVTTTAIQTESSSRWTRIAGGLQDAVREAAAMCGISVPSMYRWYYTWRDNAEDPLSLVDRRYRRIQGRSRTTLPKFLTYWHKLCSQCQRNGGVPTARLPTSACSPP